MPQIRALAICIFSHNGKILVFEGYDPLKDEIFYRPLGGGIEFGERSEEAIHRETMEEIDAEVKDLVYLGALENIFVFNGEPGHEIVQVLHRAANVVDVRGIVCNRTVENRDRTVLVEDRNGERYSDGKRYAKFYMPVQILEAVE